MTTRFTPATSLEGGTPIGSTYLSSFCSCPYKWFNTYLRPGEEVDEAGELSFIGVKPRWTSPNLSMGGMLHSALEEWYRSGCRDGEDTGERDIDRTLAALKTRYREVRDDYQMKEIAEDNYNTVKEMLLYYHDIYGPEGSVPEYPDLQVAHDAEGEPLIERQFDLSLGYGDYYATSKPDLLVLKEGFLCTWDHKSSVASFARRRAGNLDLDPQFTMEYMILSELFPEVPLDGAWVSVLVKNRAARSTLPSGSIRAKTTRSPMDVEFYKIDTLNILQQIDERVGHFHSLLQDTGDLEVSTSIAFSRHGVRTQACYAYNSTCEFMDLCVYKDRIGEKLRSFKPRSVVAAEKSREEE